MDQTLLAGQAAKSAIDWACWDVFGRSVELPIHALLGGALVWAPPAFSVVGIGTPDGEPMRVITGGFRTSREIQLE